MEDESTPDDGRGHRPKTTVIKQQPLLADSLARAASHFALSKEWEDYQQKTIKDWINAQLQEYHKDNPALNIQVNDLSKDMCDGEIILLLAKILTLHSNGDARKPKVPNRKRLSYQERGGSTGFLSFKKEINQLDTSNAEVNPVFQAMRHRENITLALGQLKDLGVNTGNVSADDFISGRIKSILAVLWKLIRHAEENLKMTPIKSHSDSSPAPSANTKLPTQLEILEQISEDRDGSLMMDSSYASEATIDLNTASSIQDIFSTDDEEELSTKMARFRQTKSDLRRSQSWSNGLTPSKTPLQLSDSSSSVDDDKSTTSAPASPGMLLNSDSNNNNADANGDKKKQKRVRNALARVFSHEEVRIDRYSNPWDNNPENRKLVKNEVFQEARDLVAKEIYTTEESYGKNLDALVLFLEKLKNHCSENELKLIFSNVQNLRNFSIKLYEELKVRIDNWSSTQVIGDIFMKFMPYMKMYQVYCNNYESAVECVHVVCKRRDVEQCLENEKKNTGGLDLLTLLITPVQRIPRYMLLLKELVKQTPETHPDFRNLSDAMTKMIDVASTVNDSMKHFQTAKTYNSIVESVKGILPYMEVHRKFVMEAQFSHAIVNKKEAKFSPIWLLLFSDMLFLASGSNKQKRKLQMHMMLEGVWLKEPSSSKYDSCLELTVPETPCLLIKIINPAERKNWFDALSDLIKENAKARNKQRASMGKSRFFKYVFSHGGVYEGDWLDGQMQGKGVYYFPNGNHYDGDWKEDLMHGTGVMTYSTGEKYEGEWEDGLPWEGTLYSGNSKYKGQFKNGKKNGKGTLTWANGDQYTGDFVDDKMEGEGKLVCADGNSYDGEWKSNMMNGKGSFHHRNGSVYDGEWVNDQKNGNGTMTYANNDVYQGMWKDNLRHGKGELKSKNNELVYNGDWVKDKKSGHGTLVKSLQGQTYLEYDGEWLDDRKHGFGELTINGCKYKGNFANDWRDGQGTFTDCTGEFIGQWKEDKRNGPGIYISVSPVKYQCEWKDDQPVGRGVVAFKDGNNNTVTEQFIEGKIHVDNRGFSYGVATLPMIKLLGK